MGVLFFDKVTPSCQDICCREIYVTSLKYPFIINAFLIETKSRNKSVSLQRHNSILLIFWQTTTFFFRVHVDPFLWWRSTKKNIQNNNNPWWNPHQPMQPTTNLLGAAQVMAFSRASYCFKVAVDVVRKISKA